MNVTELSKTVVVGTLDVIDESAPVGIPPNAVLVSDGGRIVGSNELLWDGANLTLDVPLNGAHVGSDAENNWFVNSTVPDVDTTSNSVSVGYAAASFSQESKSVAVGGEAAQTQGTESTAVGYRAAAIQGDKSVAVGSGPVSQDDESVAIHSFSAAGSQSTQSVAVGDGVGEGQQGQSVAVGYLSGGTSQGSKSVGIGSETGSTSQSSSAVAVGHEVGQTSQGSSTVAVGHLCGQTSQGEGAVGVGFDAGTTNQGVGSVAVGDVASYLNQDAYSVSVGSQSGEERQGTECVAVGRFAGQNEQANECVAIGERAGANLQLIGGVAVGREAGQFGQHQYAVALGRDAQGNDGGGDFSVAVGTFAHLNGEANECVAYGHQSLRNTPSNGITGIGAFAARDAADARTLCIGYEAGDGSVGSETVVVGYRANYSTGNANTINLNVSGTQFEPANGSNRCYINSLRSADIGTAQSLVYDTVTKEVRISSNGAKTFVINHPVDAHRNLVHACVEGPTADVFYRGETKVGEWGSASVQLPPYFEALTVPGSADVMMSYVCATPQEYTRTCEYRLFTPIPLMLENNSFIVSGRPQSTFTWVVHATRRDVTVSAEVEKQHVDIKGDGPYRYI